jgi:hypothetical protein
MAPQYETATDEEIAQWCALSNPERDIIHSLLGGFPIIQISEDVCVELGWGVNEVEAMNQQQAYEMIDFAIIRIPRVYRFFVYEDVGYLVMEYING